METRDLRNIRDILKCALCLEDVTDPRQLPCEHSFCFLCLKSLIENKTGFEVSERGATMLCPTCRAKVSITDASLPAHLIVKLFPPNHLLANLKRGIDDHETNKSSKRFFFCEDHGKTNADFVCKYHNSFLCKSCVTSKHRQSKCQVSLVETAFAELSDRKAIMKKQFEDQLNQLKDMLTVRTKADIAQQIKENTLEDIRKFRAALLIFYEKSLRTTGNLETRIEQPEVLQQVMVSVENATKLLIKNTETQLSKIDCLDDSLSDVFVQYINLEKEGKKVFDKTSKQVKEILGSVLEKDYNVERAIAVDQCCKVRHFVLCNSLNSSNLACLDEIVKMT